MKLEIIFSDITRFNFHRFLLQIRISWIPASDLQGAAVLYKAKFLIVWFPLFLIRL